MISLQEWCCGMHFRAERMKLSFIRENQKIVKAEKYSGSGIKIIFEIVQ